MILGPIPCKDCKAEISYIRLTPTGDRGMWMDDDERPHLCPARALAPEGTPLDAIEALWKTRG